MLLLTMHARPHARTHTLTHTHMCAATPNREHRHLSTALLSAACTQAGTHNRVIITKAHAPVEVPSVIEPGRAPSLGPPSGAIGTIVCWGALILQHEAAGPLAGRAAAEQTASLGTPALYPVGLPLARSGAGESLGDAEGEVAEGCVEECAIGAEGGAHLTPTQQSAGVQVRRPRPEGVRVWSDAAIALACCGVQSRGVVC